MLFSILLIVLLGLIANKLFEMIKLPGLLGLIVVGACIGPFGFNLLDENMINISADIRMIALIIILLRAGLGLNKDVLKRVGKTAIRMSIIPCLIEGPLVMLASHYLLNLAWVEAGMLGFIVAAVSPAVIVPAMLKMKEDGYGMKKGVPVIILAAASVDDVIAITLFTSFMTMGLKDGGSIWMQVGSIPFQIAGGIILGLAAGWLFVKVDQFRGKKFTNNEKLGYFMMLSIILVLLGEYLGLAGLLGVMTLGFYLFEYGSDISEHFAKSLNSAWFFAKIFLFVLIGAQVNITLALGAGLIGALIVVIGLVGRSIGVFISLRGSELNAKERLFCAIAYLPKATVQAAIGGIPLAMGFGSGELILAMAVLSVVITAPIGSAGIKFFGPRLLEKG